ncbi:MAG: hypothetical protein KME46_32795 [Brasilonema angustatum HA4187-MV1]|jgi:hypothetical protein|nr:hypothetical protein [Brasilonema angustatum HA4187-MV1]
MARPIKHGEKKAKKTVYVTDDSWEVLDKIADEFMLSRSELIEMIGQRRLKVSREETQAA